MTADPIPVAALLERVLSSVATLPPVRVRLDDAQGLALTEDVTSAVALPGFDNSAMDGYAVRRADVAGATVASPVGLPVAGEIGAGRAGLRDLPPGQAAKIMTGAPVPAGADAVVPYEWTDRGADRVTVRQRPEPGQHIRRAGEDVAVGDLLLTAGTVLGPRQLGLLAAVGLAEAAVTPRPRVVVISTGSELREPGAGLGEDGVYDANSTLLAASARRAGADVVRAGAVADSGDAFLKLLHQHLESADLVVTSGGVSQGDYDVVKESLSALGTVWFGPVAMQPGKPQGFGVVGERRVPIFTLPGNPVSAYISFEVFVLPALRRMAGWSPWSRPECSARLTTGFRSPAGRQQYARARVVRDAEGALVTPVGGHGSHLVGGLAAANALIVVPAQATSVSAGEQVRVLCLDEPF